jgi:methylated-DNA-[protein]-cysteine S-methyltransferase
MFTQYITSPLGAIAITASLTGISDIRFINELPASATPSALTELAAQQLVAYFAGTLSQFDLPLDANGTAFQQQVWQALCSIPFGATCSYAAIAHAIDNVKAVRAVGAANSRNPIAIVVPCHRVIGANGTLTGYAGGLDKKAWLLQHEQRR